MLLLSAVGFRSINVSSRFVQNKGLYELHGRQIITILQTEVFVGFSNIASCDLLNCKYIVLNHKTISMKCTCNSLETFSKQVNHAIQQNCSLPIYFSKGQNSLIGRATQAGIISN